MRGCKESLETASKVLQRVKRENVIGDLLARFRDLGWYMRSWDVSGSWNGCRRRRRGGEGAGISHGSLLLTAENAFRDVYAYMSMCMA